MIEECSAMNSCNDAEKVRSVRRTDLQFEKLSIFMELYPDFNQGRNNEAQLLEFDRLCTNLNNIGPSVHSSLRWRKLWSDYKGNNKRSSSAKKIITAPSEISHVFVESTSSSRSVQDRNSDPSEDRSKRYKKDEEENDNFHSQDWSTQYNNHSSSIDLLEMILEQQKETNKHQAETNIILKNLIEILTPQSVDDV